MKKEKHAEIEKAPEKLPEPPKKEKPPACPFIVGDKVTFHHEQFGDVPAEVADIRIDYVKVRPSKETGLSEHWLPATELKK